MTQEDEEDRVTASRVADVMAPARRAYPRPARCGHCGGPDVARAVWLGINDGKVFDLYADGATDDLCLNCGPCCAIDPPERSTRDHIQVARYAELERKKP